MQQIEVRLVAIKRDYFCCKPIPSKIFANTPFKATKNGFFDNQTNKLLLKKGFLIIIRLIFKGYVLYFNVSELSI